jgi:hypothetical protein
MVDHAPGVDEVEGITRERELFAVRHEQMRGKPKEAKTLVGIRDGIWREVDPRQRQRPGPRPLQVIDAHAHSKLEHVLPTPLREPRELGQIPFELVSGPGLSLQALG